MSVLNALLCGGHAAQPPDGKYGESRLLWDTHLCVSLNMYYSSTAKYMWSDSMT